MDEIEHAVTLEHGRTYRIALAGLTRDEAETIMMHVANMQDRRTGGPRTPSEWMKIATVDR